MLNCDSGEATEKLAALWKLIALVTEFHVCPGQKRTDHASELFYLSGKQVHAF